MDTDTQTVSNSECRERLQQAKRVLEGLSEEQRVHNFDIDIIARHSARGVVACIAGHCGLDPWFQQRGFVTFVDYPSSMGALSIRIVDFFGIRGPFFSSCYGTDERVTVEHALRALDQAIARLPRDPSEILA